MPVNVSRRSLWHREFDLGLWKRAFALTVSDRLSPALHVDGMAVDGYTDTQLVDISLALAVIALTDAFNRINDTTLDFPPAA